ncbi:hypothetical protein CYLTODRAFT_420859 [Cylindrobasidium torrendii FP15055 ss-10]|uniref:Polysaccharide lyase family 14 protein n=1 Tax=Cylindrobasidium torrendii FP15055 ss-10 TaxID=1314674 RepID=A0A0D7BHY3_9AGAR|nr:hypothetical protein CYLTODRAFT_420859 [Cylindrobasidium torrendii FP15055 ss-10]
MDRLPAFTLLLCLPTLNYAAEITPWPSLSLSRRGDFTPSKDGFYDPAENGGSFLTHATPDGLGEPINAILTAKSDSDVLVDSEEDGGLRNYFLSFQMGSECLGQHSGTPQTANLGDGNDWVNETAVIRYDYGDPQLGTCTETIKGGNHFRYWVQDGKAHGTGAIFMACSYEKPISEYHDIVPDGYNLGRDYMLGNITGSLIPTANLTNTTTFEGTTSFGGYTYKTNIRYVSGLLPNTSIGINHNGSVPVNGRNAIDGLVALLDVSITTRPDKPDAAWRSTPAMFCVLLAVLASAVTFS